MTDEEIKFLDDNAVVTKTADEVTVSLSTALWAAGENASPVVCFTERHISQWLELRGNKSGEALVRATFRNNEDANRNKTWKFSLASKKKPAKVPPAKPTKTKKTGKAKQTTNEG